MSAAVPLADYAHGVLTCVVCGWQRHTFSPDVYWRIHLRECDG